MGRLCWKRKKGRYIFGLGSISKLTLITFSSQPMKHFVNPEDVDILRSQIHALNESLQKQEQEKLEIRQELSETKKQVVALMQHLGFVGSSSRPFLSSQCNNENDDDDDGDESDYIE